MNGLRGSNHPTRRLCVVHSFLIMDTPSGIIPYVTSCNLVWLVVSHCNLLWLVVIYCDSLLSLSSLCVWTEFLLLIDSSASFQQKFLETAEILSWWTDSQKKSKILFLDQNVSATWSQSLQRAERLKRRPAGLSCECWPNLAVMIRRHHKLLTNGRLVQLHFMTVSFPD